MAFQFAHMSTFSMKGNSKGRSAGDIAAEAARLDGHAPHVDAPTPPVVLDGIDPSEIPALLDRRIAQAKADLKGAGRGTGFRADRHVLEGVVLSHPTPCPDLADPTNKAQYLAWRKDAVAWLKTNAAERGMEPVSIVEHLDERHPHLHCLSIPLRRDLNAKECHPGHVAQSASLAAGNPVKTASRAFKEAMTGWQDSYHREVGLKHGQARLGPRRRRLGRGEWQQEQTQAKALQAGLAAKQQAEREASATLAQARTRAAEGLAKVREKEAAALEVEAAAKARQAEADKAAHLAEKNNQVAAADRAAAAKERQEAAALKVEAAAYMTGIEAWADGRIVGTAQEGKSLSYRDQAALDETHPKVVPAFGRVVTFVKTMAAKVEQRIENLFKPRAVELEQHFQGLEQDAGGIAASLNKLGDRQAALEAQRQKDLAAERRRQASRGMSR